MSSFGNICDVISNHHVLNQKLVKCIDFVVRLYNYLLQHILQVQSVINHFNINLNAGNVYPGPRDVNNT
jgi:hypothetical protein